MLNVVPFVLVNFRLCINEVADHPGKFQRRLQRRQMPGPGQHMQGGVRNSGQQLRLQQVDAVDPIEFARNDDRGRIDRSHVAGDVLEAGRPWPRRLCLRRTAQAVFDDLLASFGDEPPWDVASATSGETTA